MRDRLDGFAEFYRHIGDPVKQARGIAMVLEDFLADHGAMESARLTIDEHEIVNSCVEAISGLLSQAYASMGHMPMRAFEGFELGDRRRSVTEAEKAGAE